MIDFVRIYFDTYANWKKKKNKSIEGGEGIVVKLNTIALCIIDIAAAKAKECRLATRSWEYCAWHFCIISCTHIKDYRRIFFTLKTSSNLLLFNSINIEIEQSDEPFNPKNSLFLFKVIIDFDKGYLIYNQTMFSTENALNILSQSDRVRSSKNRQLLWWNNKCV